MILINILIRPLEQPQHIRVGFAFFSCIKCKVYVNVEPHDVIMYMYMFVHKLSRCKYNGQTSCISK